jgi:hypothetical protein
VAPVRESAAQALAVAARPLPASKVALLLRHLCTLVMRPEWEVRLGGLLGIKYLLAARPDGYESLLPGAVPAVLVGLQVLHYLQILPSSLLSCRVRVRACALISSVLSESAWQPTSCTLSALINKDGINMLRNLESASGVWYLSYKISWLL